ncbi:MAG: Fic family protein [Candidatus Cyclobacteriaceae bacterium M3_2C_046]
MDQQFQQLYQEYTQLDIESAIDFQKFNLYSLVHHSTTIEGNTLTDGETQLLLDKGLTAQGKPLEHSLMVKDAYQALLFAKNMADQKIEINEEFLKNLNAKVCKSTGEVLHTALGTVDSSQGEYRKSASHAQGGGYYLSPTKIPAAMQAFCVEANQRLTQANDLKAQYELSFDLHFNLVTIHPWIDGNGRTARLLMNFIQFYFSLPLSKVYLQDRMAYIHALEETRKLNDINIFRKFMYEQQIKYFREKIDEFKSSQDRGFHLLF